MYDYDSNAIVFNALKNRKSAELKQAFIKCCKKLNVEPSRNNMFILDNECSLDIKKYNKNIQLYIPISATTSASTKCC